MKRILIIFLILISFACDHVEKRNANSISIKYEWNENIYRSYLYKFRIEFPKGWEYDNGSSKNTVARAFNRELGATMSVLVMELLEKPKNPDNIFESSPYLDFEKDFNKFLSVQNINAENLELSKGALNNFPAYMLEFTTNQSSGIQSYIYLTQQIQTYYNSKIYQVTFNIPEDYYNSEMANEWDWAVNSFKFEIAY